jgi:hypothetical protein
MTAAFGDAPLALAGALELAARVLREADDRARVEPLPLFVEPLPLLVEPLPLFWPEPFELRDVVFRLVEEGVFASATAPP